jgi:hypothetical protein
LRRKVYTVFSSEKDGIKSIAKCTFYLIDIRTAAALTVGIKKNVTAVREASTFDDTVYYW